MMKATEQLKNEHEAVKLMMKILDAACGNLKAGNKPQVADFEDMIDFLKVFVDRCHHGKEEQILFPVGQGCVPLERHHDSICLI